MLEDSLGNYNSFFQSYPTFLFYMSNNSIKMICNFEEIIAERTSLPTTNPSMRIGSHRLTSMESWANFQHHPSWKSGPSDWVVFRGLKKPVRI